MNYNFLAFIPFYYIKEMILEINCKGHMHVYQELKE